MPAPSDEDHHTAGSHTAGVRTAGVRTAGVSPASCIRALATALAVALALTAAAAPGAFASAGPASGSVLARHEPGTPMDVLFVFGPAAGDWACLCRFFDDGSRRVEVFSLEGPEARAALTDPRPSPAFLPGRDPAALISWTAAAAGVPVHHIVQVGQRCWPAFATWPGVDSNPLLEMAAAYPGKPSEPVPPSLAVSEDAFTSAVETDPGTDEAAVLGMLARIEDARRLAVLRTYGFDGGRTVNDLVSGEPDARGDYARWAMEMCGVRIPRVHEPPELFMGNHLVTFDPGAVPGKMPAAVPVTVISGGNPSLMRVALTIDDGWDADMRILDLLEAWRIRFTAFPIGEYADTPEGMSLVRRVYEMGGEVCSHTWSHRTMRGLPDPVLAAEIWRGVEAIAQQTHEVFPYVRFSGGDFDAAALNLASRQGFWVVNWTIDSLDTKTGLSTDQRVDYVLKRLKPGAIILAHFGGIRTYDLLARLIPLIQAQGYEVTTLTRVLEGTPFRLDR